MKAIINLLTLLLLMLNVSQLEAQTLQELVSKADSAYFDHKDYSTAIKLYKQVREQSKPSDEDYAYATDKIARSLFLLEMDTKSKQGFAKAMPLAKDFIGFVEREEKYIHPEIAAKKYFLIKDMVVGHFELGERDKARQYQDILYKAYKDKKLPDGIDMYYNFEFFKWNNLNVWGYEWFPELGDPETEGSFSKQVYYIYSTDENGKDKDQLYRLHVLKIHKIEEMKVDYVLTKRVDSNNAEWSGTLWKYTFESPIDYEKVHNAVIEVLEGKARPGTESIKKKN